MNKRVKIIAIILFILGFCYFIIPFLLHGLIFVSREALCGKEVLQKLNSNDGKHTAYLYEFSCGATTGNAYEVSILESSQSLYSEPGNVYSSTSKPYNLHWNSDSQLEIGASSSSENYSKNDHYQNIRVSYVEPNVYDGRFDIGTLMKNAKSGLHVNFNSAATDDQIKALEAHIGYTLPSTVKDTLLTYNGQVNHSAWYFLSTEEIANEWDYQRKIWSEYDPSVYGSEANIIKHEAPWHPKWLPFMSNGSSGIVAIDMDPAIHGTYGQIITVYDNGTVSSVLSESYADFLNKLVVNQGDIEKMTGFYEIDLKTVLQ